MCSRWKQIARVIALKWPKAATQSPLSTPPNTPQVAPATYHDHDRSISNMYFFEWSINCSINKLSNIYRTFCVNCFNLLFVAFVIVLFSFSLFANTLFSLFVSSFLTGKFCAQLRAVIARIARQGASPMANSHCCFALLLLLFVLFSFFISLYSHCAKVLLAWHTNRSLIRAVRS